MSEKMLQVIKMVSKGFLNKEIAYETGLSYGTVRVYLSQIYAATGLRNRVELAVKAHKFFNF